MTRAQSDRLAALLQTEFGLTGPITRLDGELDENFRVQSDTGDIIFKLMRPGAETPLVEMQIAALEHVQGTEVAKKLPRPIPTRDGEPYTWMEIEGEPRLGWALSFLPGTLLGKLGKMTGAMARELGSNLAHLDRALEGFEHVGLDRELKWDPLHAGWIGDHLELHLRPERREIVTTIFERYQEALHTQAERLPRAVIYGDANDMNLLFEGAEEPRLAGIIDFGDMMHSVRIGEAVIATAYAAMWAADPVDCAAELLAAYHAVLPLQRNEIAAFFPLVLTRLSVTVTNAALGRAVEPENAYLQVSESAAWSMLQELHDVDLDEIERRMLLACQNPLRSRSESTEALLSRRHRVFAENQRLSYSQPFRPVRGERHFLFDDLGRRYLDAYNNVPHVGHAHPRVVEAVSTQIAALNTNSRYLTELPIRLAERICAKLPASLSRCFFLNSASEANEVALRLVRAATGRRELLVLQHGYHGCTTGAVDISPYKFHHEGMTGAPDWVHEVAQPDFYRGDYWRSHPEDLQPYLDSVRQALERAQARGGVGGFICENLPSVGGQIVMPPGYLRAVYEMVRRAGGLCISDDVQTGLGRLGQWFWGFEQQEVVPDLLVLGKPMGNGFPLAAVITTDAIADAFTRGPEFFSTFGGSSASAAAGNAVLDVLEDENLPAHAKTVGECLRRGFEGFASRHGCIGDVRGMGLFWGLDLVTDAESRAPATALAARVKNELYRRHVLIGTDGPHDNVLKVRPPMTFDLEAADRLLMVLEETLKDLGPMGRAALGS